MLLIPGRRQRPFMFETDIGIHGAANRLAIARPQEATLKIADTGTDLAGLIVPAFVGPFGIGNYARPGEQSRHNLAYWRYQDYCGIGPGAHGRRHKGATERHKRSEEHTSELQSLMRISYAVFCLKKKNTQQ